jgi:type IV secretion system protein VirB4
MGRAGANAHLDGPPLIVTRTGRATPFRLVTHIGDVGNTLVAGPTGMGKSVLLATLAMQFRRYRGSRIFAFDMGRSMRRPSWAWAASTTTWARMARSPSSRWPASTARATAPGPPNGSKAACCTKAWPSADEKAAIWSALGSLAGAPVEQRTLTGLSVLLQSNAAPGARALCAGRRARQAAGRRPRPARHGRRAGFEMEELMHSKAAVLAVLRYLFALR